MPSLSGKIEMLMESYEQSKRTPAYRELRSKYKALKKSHKEIVLALSALAQGISLNNAEVDVYEDAPKKKHRSKKARKCAYLEELDQRTDLKDQRTDLKDQRTDLKDQWTDLKDEEHARSDAREEVTTHPSVSTSQDIIPDPAPLVIKIEPNLVGNYTEREAEIEAGVDLEEEEVVVEEDVEVEEVVIEEEVEEEVEEVEEVVEEEEEVEEDEEAGVYEIEIEGTRYYTTGEQDGIVYKIDGEDDVGDEIGKFVNGKFKLNK